MTFRNSGAFIAVIAAIVVGGCSATPPNTAPTADEIKAAQQNAVKRAESNTQLSPQQRAAIEQHLGGVTPAEASARSGDLHKK